MVMEFCRPFCEDGPEYGAASICMEQACDVQPETCGTDSGPVPEYGMIQVYGMRIFLLSDAVSFMAFQYYEEGTELLFLRWNMYNCR